MENQKKKKKKFFFQIGNFLSGIGKNILFGIGHGAEFRPQNRVIKSPVIGELWDQKCKWYLVKAENGIEHKYLSIR